MRETLARAHVSTHPLLFRLVHCYVTRLNTERYEAFRARVRRELQDVVTKLIDRCLTLAARPPAVRCLCVVHRPVIFA
jgi:hypothetical protein